MHKDPSYYFWAIKELASKLQAPGGIDPIEMERLILSGALYLRKLAEHDYLADTHKLKGRAFGGTNVLDFCDRLMHSLMIDTGNVDHIVFNSDRAGHIETSLSEIVALFDEYADNGYKGLPTAMCEV